MALRTGAARVCREWILKDGHPASRVVPCEEPMKNEKDMKVATAALLLLLGVALVAAKALEKDR